MSKRESNGKGFTIIEMIIVIVMISILAAAVTPVVFQKVSSEREASTRDEIVLIYQAIMGDTNKGNSGYLGDMGGLPSALADLNTNPGATTNSAETCGVGVGWAGPYILTGFDTDDYLKDAWGNNYVYNSPGTGQIKSYGPDGASGGGDDLVFPEDAVTANGTLSITVTANDLLAPSSSVDLDNGTAQVTVYYSNNGTESSTSATWNAGDQAFEVTAHQGVHCIFAEGLNGAGTGAPDPDDYSGLNGYLSHWTFGGRTVSATVHIK